MRDFQNLIENDFVKNSTQSFEMLEGGDAVSFEFGEKTKRITVRPSGTEPKMKIYTQWLFEKAEEQARIEQILEEFKEKIL